MIAWLRRLFAMLTTEKDGVTFCETRIMSLSAFVVLSTQFVRSQDHDWKGYAIAVGILAAAMIGKNWQENQ